jgi:hypothetical protein
MPLKNTVCFPVHMSGDHASIQIRHPVRSLLKPLPEIRITRHGSRPSDRNLDNPARSCVRARARERRAASAPTDQNPSRPGPARRAARRSSHRAVSRFGIQCAGARAARLVGALDGGRGRQPACRCRSRGWKHPSGRRGRHGHPHRQRQRLRLGTSGMRGFALTVYEAAAAAAAATVPETTRRSGAGDGTTTCLR